MSLFEWGRFALASGEISTWKIECDALGTSDWEAVGHIATKLGLVEPFSYVSGVPTGGFPLAMSMTKYVQRDAPLHLVVDDVWTTGGSMTRFIEQQYVPNRGVSAANVRGLVLFARQQPPWWCQALFIMPGRR